MKKDHELDYVRFNALLNGPLKHPLPMFTISRLAQALLDVVEATHPNGMAALEKHCRARQQKDANGE